MITANTFFNRVRYQGDLPKGSWPVYWRMIIIPELIAKHLPVSQELSVGKPLRAYVNHGRWVVKCECGGAEKAWEEGLFMCQSCFNSKHQHRLRLAMFPKNRAEIEKLLLVRPLENRNWSPSETLAFLKAENSAHKSELLGVA